MIRKILAVLLTLTLLSHMACTTLRPLSFDEITSLDSDAELQVVFHDSSEVIIHSPVLGDEVLFGQNDDGSPVSIPKSQIRAMALKERDKKKTVMMSVAGVVSAAILIGALTIQSPDNDCGST